MKLLFETLKPFLNRRRNEGNQLLTGQLVPSSVHVEVTHTDKDNYSSNDNREKEDLPS